MTTPNSDKGLSLVARFRESMAMNHERWHDGLGYDLSLLDSATPQERAEIEQLLFRRGVHDSRDAEALAALRSPAAEAALRRAFSTGDLTIQLAVLLHASDRIDDVSRTATLVAALENTEVYGGLTQALLLIEEYHPPEIVHALLRGVLRRDGATAGEFAAMLLFIHGKATSAYDMDQRPFFLRFQEEDRKVLFRELCERIGVDEQRQQRLLAEMA